MATVRRATASWSGDLLVGERHRQRLHDRAVHRPARPAGRSRTEEPDGRTSPEELLAAAHAACFSMAFSNELAKAGYTPDHLHVVAEVSFEKREAGWTVIGSALQVVGTSPTVPIEEFERIAGRPRTAARSAAPWPATSSSAWTPRSKIPTTMARSGR